MFEKSYPFESFLQNTLYILKQKFSKVKSNISQPGRDKVFSFMEVLWTWLGEVMEKSWKFSSVSRDGAYFELLIYLRGIVNI